MHIYFAVFKLQIQCDRLEAAQSFINNSCFL